MLPAWSPAELLAEVLAPPRQSFVALPGQRVIDRVDWFQVVTPSFTTGGMNEVALAVMTTDIEATIDRTIAEYRAAGLQFRWRVTCESRPLDLGARLARRGFRRTVAHAMARSTTSSSNAAPGVVVERVHADTVATFSRVMAEGWNVDRVPFGVAHAAMLAPGSPHRLYLASIDGEPVGVGAAVMFERSCYLMSGVVLPAHRRRGVYGALVAARLADARALGKELVTSYANAETSAPILARLGFEALTLVDTYYS